MFDININDQIHVINKIIVFRYMYINKDHD